MIHQPPVRNVVEIKVEKKIDVPFNLQSNAMFSLSLAAKMKTKIKPDLGLICLKMIYF